MVTKAFLNFFSQACTSVSSDRLSCLLFQLLTIDHLLYIPYFAILIIPIANFHVR